MANYSFHPSIHCPFIHLPIIYPSIHPLTYPSSKMKYLDAISETTE